MASRAELTGSAVPVNWSRGESGNTSLTPPQQRNGRLITAPGRAHIPTLAGVACIAILLPLRHVWFVELILLGLTLTVPGVLALRALRIPRDSVSLYPVYVPAAAVLVVMVAGFLIDILGPTLGIARPLHGDTTALATVAVCIVLWLIGLGAPTAAQLAWRSWLTDPVRLLPLALPLLTAAGALLLNNGDGGTLARIGSVAGPITLLVTLAAAHRLTRAQTVMLLFACALSAEWALSLRSQEVVGFDIATEIHVAQVTQAAGIWHSHHPNDPYSAMLSLTVLPSTLASLTGISPVVAFKALYPLLAALIPVSVFFLAERLVRRPFAVGAAGLVIVQSYFFVQLPELARQEIGLLFFAALLLALTDPTLARGRSVRLASAMALGLVVSHYSSAYVALLTLPLALLAEVVLFRKRSSTRFAAGGLIVFVVLAGAAVLWNGPITDSASNVTSFVHKLSKSGLDFLPTSSGGVVNSYLGGNSVTNVSAPILQILAVQQFRQYKYIHPLPAANQARFNIRTAQVPSPQQRLAPLPRVINIFQVIFGELMLVFAGLGTLVAITRRQPQVRHAGMLALGTIVTLTVIRFSGTFADAYNQTRALLQCLLLLAPVAALLAQLVVDTVSKRRATVRRALIVSLALAFPLMFAYEDGATFMVVGGDPPLTLANSGETFERYYQTPQELSAADWAARASAGKLLYADRYGQLRLSDASRAVAVTVVIPRTLDDAAWIYGTRTNVVLGRARAQVGDYFGTYRWPKAFLNDYFDLVYDNGQSQVFHR